MILTYDTHADVLYLFATDRVTEVVALEQSPRQHPGPVGEGLTIFGDHDKTILGVRCASASTRLNLDALPLGGMQIESKATIEQALATLKSVLDGAYFGECVLDIGTRAGRHRTGCGDKHRPVGRARSTR